MNVQGQSASLGVNSLAPRSAKRISSAATSAVSSTEFTSHGVSNSTVSSNTGSSLPVSTKSVSTSSTASAIATSPSKLTSSTLSPSSIDNSHQHHSKTSDSSTRTQQHNQPLTETQETTNHPIAQFNLKSGAISVSGLSVAEQSQSLLDVFNQQTGADENKVSTGVESITAIDTSLSGSNLTKDTIISEQTNAANTDIGVDEQNNPLNKQIIGTDQTKDSEQEQQEAQQVQVDAQIIKELSARDTEVKTHEQAHAAVGGSLAHSPQYTYENGPDGKRYAVEGEVNIDVGVIEGNAQATFNKMQKVYAAAMAPVQPSMADIQVANEAVQKMNEAKKELSAERQEKIMGTEDVEHINDLGQHLALFGEQGFTPIYPFDQTNEQNNSSHSMNNETNSNSTTQYSSINIAV